MLREHDTWAQSIWLAYGKVVILEFDSRQTVSSEVFCSNLLKSLQLNLIWADSKFQDTSYDRVKRWKNG